LIGAGLLGLGGFLLSAGEPQSELWVDGGLPGVGLGLGFALGLIGAACPVPAVALILTGLTAFGSALGPSLARARTGEAPDASGCQTVERSVLFEIRNEPQLSYLDAHNAEFPYGRDRV